jgi:hypothetical protein
VGVELFKGTLHYRCALPGFVETPGHPQLATSEAYAASGRVLAATLSELRTTAGGAADGVPRATLDAAISAVAAGVHAVSASGGESTGRGPPSRRGLALDQADFDTEVPCAVGRHDMCEAGETCAYFDEDPVNDLMSFDHVGVALLVLLQVKTLGVIQHTLCCHAATTRRARSLRRPRHATTHPPPTAVFVRATAHRPSLLMIGPKPCTR